MLKVTILSLSAAFSLSFLPQQITQGTVLNGSFETGLNNWNNIGQVSADTSSFGVNPVNGNYQAVLQTCFFDSNSGGCDDGQSLSDANSLESFLGLLTNDLTSSGVTEGSAIKQSITANAGDILSFSWNFLTDEDPANIDYNDFAFFTIDNSKYFLADIQSSFPVDPSFSSLSKETGYQPYSYTFTSAGTYTLGFGVVDVDLTGNGDTTINSALLIDNIRLTNGSAKVPEPSVILGLLTVLGLTAKCKRKHSLLK